MFGAQEATPFVSIVEFPRPDTAPIQGDDRKLRRLEEWELQVQGWTNTTQANPTDELYGLKGAIEHRLARFWTRKGNRFLTIGWDAYSIACVSDPVWCGQLLHKQREQRPYTSR